MLTEILYRLSRPDLKFQDNFLVTNSGSGPMYGYMVYMKVTEDDAITVPMVHPEDWRVIARTVFWKLREEGVEKFKLLHIDSGLVQNLKVKPHPFLPNHGEYSGKVPRKAIIFQQDWTWIKTGKPIRDIEQELLRNHEDIFRGSEGYDLILDS